MLILPEKSDSVVKLFFQAVTILTTEIKVPKATNRKVAADLRDEVILTIDHDPLEAGIPRAELIRIGLLGLCSCSETEFSLNQ